MAITRSLYEHFDEELIASLFDERFQDKIIHRKMFDSIPGTDEQRPCLGLPDDDDDSLTSLFSQQYGSLNDLREYSGGLSIVET